MDRNCNKCIHHISGQCCKWDCEMETLDDFRNKVIDEFAEVLRLKCLDNVYKEVSLHNVLKIAEQIKAGVK